MREKMVIVFLALISLFGCQSTTEREVVSAADIVLEVRNLYPMAEHLLNQNNTIIQFLLRK